MDPILFRAILAMDAYNRGYAPGVKGLGVSAIGDATFFKDADDPEGVSQSAGFYAVAYTLGDGSKVISYRGTDKLAALPFSEIGGDIWNGYTLGIGSPAATQAAMAIEFYKAVAEGADPRSASIALTGHSLGGALAGFVGALYGKTGSLFDNMPFEAGANAAYTNSVPQTFINEFGLEGVIPPNADLRALVYGGSDPWMVDRTHLNATHVDGEFLAAGRSQQQTVSAPLDPGPGIDLPGLDSGALGGNLHSISLLVLLKYAYSTPGVGTDWKSASRYFVPALYRDEIADAVGAAAFKGSDKAATSDVMRDAIAYSAVDVGSPSEGKPFGDSAIRALFDDAAGGYWTLASNAPVLDAAGNAIARATLEQVLAQGADWSLEQAWSPTTRGTPVQHREAAPYLVEVIAGRAVIRDWGASKRRDLRQRKTRPRQPRQAVAVRPRIAA